METVSSCLDITPPHTRILQPPTPISDATRTPTWTQAGHDPEGGRFWICRSLSKKVKTVGERGVETIYMFPGFLHACTWWVAVLGQGDKKDETAHTGLIEVLLAVKSRMDSIIEYRNIEILILFHFIVFSH